ncbi:MAG: dihydrofolate reductase family protein [Fervidobacterium sp.]
MRVHLVVVTDVRGIIATSEYDNVRWSSKEDKALFKQITTETGVVVMGRKTYESIGRNLPGRLNIVLTSKSSEFFSQVNLSVPEVIMSGDVEDVVDRLNSMGYESISVIGGQSVFTQFIISGIVTDLHITVEPILLPGNINVFSDKIEKKYDLVLENIRKLNDKGTINMHYKVKKHY